MNELNIIIFTYLGCVDKQKRKIVNNKEKK